MSTPVLMACAAWICDPGFGVGASAALEGVIQNRNDPLLFLQRREGDGERTGFSLRNIRLRVADCLGNKLIFRMRETHVIVTAGHAVIAQARFDGTLARLEAGGVQVVPDICWCSISEPVFPPQTKALMTNSGKYPHYGPGLSGRDVRFGSMADCDGAALSGRALSRLPDWLG